MTAVRTAAATLLLATALAACTADARVTVAESDSPSPPATTQAPTPARAALETDLADGRHHARVTGYDGAAHTVTIDVVQFFTGDAAVRAAVEDGYDAGDVANDHYTRNTNPRLRTLTVADDVEIVVNTLAFERNGDSTKDTVVTDAELEAFVADGSAPHALFEVRIAGGVVVALEEQFLP